MADKIIFNLDGNSVEAEPGETIWEVAKKQGPQMKTAPMKST